MRVMSRQGGKEKEEEKEGQMGRETGRRIVAKASDGQRYPMPLSKFGLKCDGERGSGPEGADDVSIL